MDDLIVIESQDCPLMAFEELEERLAPSSVMGLDDSTAAVLD